MRIILVWALALCALAPVSLASSGSSSPRTPAVQAKQRKEAPKAKKPGSEKPKAGAKAGGTSEMGSAARTAMLQKKGQVKPPAKPGLGKASPKGKKPAAMTKGKS